MLNSEAIKKYSFLFKIYDIVIIESLGKNDIMWHYIKEFSNM